MVPCPFTMESPFTTLTVTVILNFYVTTVIMMINITLTFMTLVTGQMDAQLNLAGGDSKWSPLVADINPYSPGMEIISVPNGTTIDSTWLLEWGNHDLL